MKEELDEEESKRHNIFTDLNFVKSNKINYNYKECINKMKNVTGKLENLIDIIDESIGKETSFSKRMKKKSTFNEKTKRPGSAQFIRRTDKIFLKDETRRNYLKSSKIKKFNDFKKKNAKNKYRLKSSQSVILKKNDKDFNYFNYRKINHNKYDIKYNSKNNSLIIGNKLTYRETKLDENKFKNDTSTKNKIFNSNNSTNKVNNSSTITVFYPKYYKAKNKRPKSANIYNRTIHDYLYKKNKYKYISSSNTSKNFSHSKYRTLTTRFFNNSDYSKLRSNYLLEFLKESSNIKNSYKKDLINVYMKKDTRDLMKIAKKEIKMKDPEYHKKQIFKNIIKVKKTLKYVKKMREEQKFKMDYFGPGNINNKGYIRKKNANLIRFFDEICHMKDEKFYMYHKLLNELYPNLLKNAVKKKYKMPEKEYINEKEMEKNEETIKKLISILKKH